MFIFPGDIFHKSCFSPQAYQLPVEYTSPHLVRYTKALSSALSCAALRLIHPTLQCSGSRYTLGPTYSLEVKNRNRVVIWWLAGCWQLPLGKSVPKKEPMNLRVLKLKRKEDHDFLVIYTSTTKIRGGIIDFNGRFQPKDLQGGTRKSSSHNYLLSWKVFCGKSSHISKVVWEKP